MIKEAGVESKFDKVDSFGTAGYHVGETPDSRSVGCCVSHNVPVSHRAQKFTLAQFDKFDFIFAMDSSNLQNIKRLQPSGSQTKVMLFGEYGTDPKFDKIVDDPYYGGKDGFEWNFKQIYHFSENFIKQEVSN